MEKEFIIAEKTYNGKVFYFVLPAVAVILFFSIFNEYLLLLIEDRLLFSLLVLVVFIYIIFVMIAVKNYKTLGRLALNPDEVRIEINNKTNKYNMSDINSMRLSYRGIYGEDVAGWAGGMYATISRDGSGNILTFSVQENKVNVNLAFESEEDFSAILFLFNKIRDKHGLQPEIVKRAF